jgi:predicted GNAT family acetyltransferase
MSPVARSFPISIADDPSLNRYELLVDGELAATANYLLVARKIVFNYTELLPGFEGRGLGQQLATAVLDDVRQRQLTVVARCPFFSTFIEDHPGYGDLVDPPLAESMPMLRIARG